MRLEHIPRMVIAVSVEVPISSVLGIVTPISIEGSAVVLIRIVIPVGITPSASVGRRALCGTGRGRNSTSIF